MYTLFEKNEITDADIDKMCKSNINEIKFVNKFTFDGIDKLTNLHKMDPSNGKTSDLDQEFFYVIMIFWIIYISIVRIEMIGEYLPEVTLMDFFM